MWGFTVLPPTNVKTRNRKFEVLSDFQSFCLSVRLLLLKREIKRSCLVSLRCNLSGLMVTSASNRDLFCVRIIPHLKHRVNLCDAGDIRYDMDAPIESKRRHNSKPGSIWPDRLAGQTITRPRARRRDDFLFYVMPPVGTVHCNYSKTEI